MLFELSFNLNHGHTFIPAEKLCAATAALLRLEPEIIRTVMDEFGYDEVTARAFHRDMTYYSYGLAILANTGHLALTETELREAFRREFRALAAYYGPPKKLPEFAERENAVHQLFR